MKKRFFILIISLLLVLTTTACGTQSADGSDTIQDTPYDSAADDSGFSQDTPDGFAADDSGFSQDTPDGFVADDSGFSQDTPDGSAADNSGFSQDTPDSPAFDGPDLDLSGLAGIDSSGTATGVYADLQDWITSSEDAASTVQSTNQSLASTGITFDLTVDGSILVYQYYLPDGYFKDGLAEEDLAAAFDSMVDAGSASVGTIVSVFMDKYGLNIDAVRFAYYSKDGTELYSRDVRP